MPSLRAKGQRPSPHAGNWNTKSTPQLCAEYLVAKEKGLAADFCTNNPTVPANTTNDSREGAQAFGGRPFPSWWIDFVTEREAQCESIFIGAHGEDKQAAATAQVCNMSSCTATTWRRCYKRAVHWCWLHKHDLQGT